MVRAVVRALGIRASSLAGAGAGERREGREGREGPAALALEVARDRLIVWRSSRSEINRLSHQCQEMDLSIDLAHQLYHVFGFRRCSANARSSSIPPLTPQ